MRNEERKGSRKAREGTDLVLANPAEMGATGADHVIATSILLHQHVTVHVGTEGTRLRVSTKRSH